MSGIARARRWTGWSNRKPSVIRPFPVLRMEQLEDRVTPAQTFTWTGAGGNNLWSNAGNWTGSPGSPNGDPSDPEDLVFPAGVAAALRATNNDIGNGIFNSITFGDGGYALSGNSLTLGESGVLGSGFIVANAGPTTATNDIQLNITLGVSSLSSPFPSVQTFTVQTTAQLTISGRINGIAVSTLTKDGPGTLTLSGNNTTLAGPVKIADNAGALIITHSNALGSTAEPTTVGVNSSLEVSSGGLGLNIDEPLILNGPGTTNLGALWNIAGNNTWTGPITLDSNASIGATVGTVLTITGVIGDSAGGRNLTKSDQGEVRLNSSTGNTYRGFTTVEDGILTVGHRLGLGAPDIANGDVPSAANGTLVKQTLTGRGQLRLADAFGTGFTVLDEFLTLNGNGRDGRGSLFNQSGNNQWAGPVTLGSATGTTATTATIGAITGSNMTVSGIVSGNFPLIKGVPAPTGSATEQGRIIFNNANTYVGGTTVNQGFLNIRDSRGLGTNAVSVVTGASLELEVEFPLGPTERFDPHNRDLWNDSVTLNPNRLTVANAITLTGPGQGTTNTGALHSISGINITTGNVTLLTAASIGVDNDIRPGAPSQDRGYFTNDYSLTVNILKNPDPPVIIQGDLTKRGLGHLILPNANGGFYSQTFIEQGWMTIRNNQSLGINTIVRDIAAPINNSYVPVVTVSSGAALHLFPFAGLSLTIPQYISLSGLGTSTPGYSFIKQKGALMSLDGNNLWTGDITLNGAASIGVEQVVPGSFSELTVGPGAGTGFGTGSIKDGAAAGGLTKFGSRRLILQADGTYSGAVNIQEGTIRAQSDTALGQATSGSFTTQETYIQSNTTVSSGALLELATTLPRLTGGIPTGLEVWAERLVLNAPGQQVAIAGLPSAGGTFSLTYQYDTAGNTETSGPLALTINAPQLEAILNDTALFPNLLSQVGSISVLQSGNVFTIRYGTARTPDIQLANLVWSATPGAEVVTSGANAPLTTLSNTAAATPVYNSLTNLADDHAWRGPVTLTESTRVNAAGGTRLSLLGSIDDATNLNPAGSDLVKRGPSEVVLGGSSSFRGQVRIDQGIATAVNSGAFGASGTPANGTIVAPGTQLQLQGSLTVAGEHLDVQGSGWTQSQLLTLGGTGGSFSLNFLGRSTPVGAGALPYNATASAVQAALSALTSVTTPPEIQTVTVNGTSGTFTLTYGASSTAALPVGTTAAALQTALNGIVPVGGSTLVTSTTLGTTTTYTIVFAGNLATVNATQLAVVGAGGLLATAETILAGAGPAGTVTVVDDPMALPLGSRLLITFGGSLANPTLPAMTVANAGLSTAAIALGTNASTPTRMLNAGPAPINNGLSIQNRPTTGRVTGVATDPVDPNTIYIATAGGGAWKTKNGGLSWIPLFDAPPNAGVMYGGSIAVDQNNPRTIYYATGESNGTPNGNPIQGPQDNYAGTGVYRSTDAGQTWTLLTGGPVANPIAGQAVTKLVIDPAAANTIYVATSNRNVLNPSSVTTTVAGVWRFNATGWFNIVDSSNALASNARRTAALGGIAGQAPYDLATAPPIPPPGFAGGGSPGTPGPDDDYRITWPATTTPSTWSDLFISSTGVLFAALSDTTERSFFWDNAAGSAVQQAVRKGVYWTSNPTSNTPNWNIGNGVGAAFNTNTVDRRLTTNFNTGTLTNPTGPAGYIKLAGSSNPVPPPPFVNVTTNVYASMTDITTDQMVTIYRAIHTTAANTTTGWIGAAAPPVNPFGTAAPFLGHYDHVLTAPHNSNTVYFGGFDQLYVSINNGVTWANILPDGAGAYPAHQHHAMAMDVNGQLITGSDGGVWRYTGGGAGTFSNLNGANLSITQLNSADQHPTDLNRALAGSQDNGTLQFGAAGITPPAWRMIDPAPGLPAPASSGTVRYDPSNPNTAFAVRDGRLWRTTNGGTTWVAIRNVTSNPPVGLPSATLNTFPMIVDNVNPARVLVGGYAIGGSGLLESNDARAATPSFTNLNARDTLGNLMNVTGIGIATFQGPFRPDAGFGAVIDKLANTYDPDTIYVTDGRTVSLTKDHGINWVSRTPTSTPRFVYTVSFGGAFTGANANVGPLVSTPGAAAGITIATVQNGNATGVQEIQTIDQNNASTGTYTLQFTAPPGLGGATAVTLDIPVGAPAATIQAALQNLASIGGVGGTVSVSGPVVTGLEFADIAVDPSNRDIAYLTTIHREGIGQRVFRTVNGGVAWTNITGNLPDVPARKVVVDPRSGTIYVGNDRGVYSLANAATTTTFGWKNAGAELPVVQVRDLVLNQQTNTLTVASYGRGMSQLILGDYQQNSGVLRAVSGASSWTGPVTLSGNTSIGVAGTQQIQNGIATASLDILGPISDATAGANFTVTKVGLGTLIFSGSNSYGGLTQVQEGVLRINNPHALGGNLAVPGDAGLGTIVTDGAALEMRTDLQAETVTLNGNGIRFPDGSGGFTGFNGHFTGALRNVANPNTFTGTILFGTSTNGRITIGVDTGSKLTIGTSATLLGPGIINDAGTGLQLDKELTGTLILSSPNTIGSTVRVVQGALQVQDAGALGVGGSLPTGTLVLDGAQLQISRNSRTLLETLIADEFLTLNGTGIGQTGALLNVREDGSPVGTNRNTWNGPITLTTLNPAFSPPSVPGTQIGIGVSLASDLLTINGIIGQSVALPNKGLIKYGPGRLTLTAANTYAGLTTVDSGWLRIANNAALGTSGTAANGTVVDNGATLELDGTPTALTVPEFLTILGTGVANAGALSNVAHPVGVPNVYSGPITLATTLSVLADGIGAAAGTTLSVTGAVQDPTPIPVPAAQLRKLGTGTVVFTNDKTYGGATVVAAGTLRIQSNEALGTNRSEQQRLEVIGLAGTFSLTFNGDTTPQLPFNAPASGVGSIEEALQNLLSIGAGNVTVTQIPPPVAGNNKYLITFSGALANADQTTITVPPPPPGSAVTGVITVVQDGEKGTTVLDNATLELNNVGVGINLAGEPLTITGAGFGGVGAILSTGGSNSISGPAPVTLAGHSTVGTQLGSDALTFLTPLAESGGVRNVDIVGPGTVHYRSNTDNAYTGTTTVQQGTLVLNQTAGTTAILGGPLVVGDGVGAAGSASVVVNIDEQIDNAVAVNVLADGRFDVNGRTETIGALSIASGTVVTGPNGVLATNALTMIGGTIALGTVGFPGQLVMNGNATTTPAGATAPRINGPGSINVNGADRTFTVNDGAPADDLVISAGITGTGGGRFVKAGAGRLTFETIGGSAIPVVAQSGDVQVGDGAVPNATIGPVQLAGGSLSGTGTVGTITDTGLGGTVSPGIGGVGVLRSGADVWGTATTFTVNLSASAHPNPTAGLDYDQLQVAGSINLNGATLTGVLGAGVLVGDRFTIITATGGVTGTFAAPLGPNKVFIGGQKFTVDYSNPNQVVLIRALADATVGLASSANPSTNAQPVTITATVNPEAGVATPSTGSVTFTVNRTSPSAAAFAITKPVNASGQAFLVNADFPPGFFAGLPSTGLFTFTATYSDGSVAFNDTPVSATLNQEVEVPVIGPVVVAVPPGGATPLIISPTNPSSFGIQDIAVITSSVSEERAATPTPPTWTVTVTNGTNTRTITGTGLIAGSSFPISATWNGRDNFNVVMPDGSYNVSASFLDQYGNTGVSTQLNAIAIDNTSPQVGTLANSNPIIAPGTASTVPTATTLSATIVEPNLSPSGWTLTITRGAATIRNFSGTGTSVSATWNGTQIDNVTPVADGDYLATLIVTDRAGNRTTTTSTITVLTAPPTLTLQSNSATTYGQGITLTTTVGVSSALASLLVGNTVDFYQVGNPTPVGSAPIAFVGGQYRATVTLVSPIYTVTGSPYRFTSAYPGTTNFLPGTSNQVLHTINPVELTVTATDLVKVYGAAIPALSYTADALQFADTLADVFAGDLSLSNTVSQSSAVGVYPNVVTQGSLIVSNPNYSLTSFQDGSLTVTPAPLTVVADAKTKDYGAAVPPLTFALSGLVNGDTPSVLTGALGLATPVTAASPIGFYADEIIQGTLAASNYSIAFTPASLTIVPATLSVVANNVSKVYGAPVPPLAFSITGLAAGDTASSVLTGSLALAPGLGQSSPVNVYSNAVTQGTLTLTSPNYVLSFTPGTFTVTQATLVLAANNQTKVYGDPVGALTFVVQSGLTNGDTASVITGSPGLTTPVGPTSPAGVYPNEITRGTLAAGPNYTLAFTNGTMTVTPAPIAIQANPASKVYGDAVPALSFTVNGLKNGESAASAVAGALTTNPAVDLNSAVGNYPIIQGTVRVISQNYTLTSFTGSALSVTRAPLTIVVNNATRAFNSPNPTFTAVHPYTGLKLTDTDAVVSGLNLSTAVAQNAAPGTYVDAITGGSPTAANYAITVLPGDLTVTPLPSDVAFGSGAGAPARVNVYTPEGNFRTTVFPTSPNYNNTTGIRTAAADFNLDGVTDIVMGNGPGAPTLVTVINGSTKQPMFVVQPFESSFTGGVFVAVGDVDGDGRPDLVVTPDEGGGPRTQVYRGTNFEKFADYLGIDDAKFRGGARAAVGDVDNDGFGDIIVAAGFGGGPRVSIWSGQALSQSGQFVHPVNDFFIFGGDDVTNLRNGVFIAAGDLNGDGFADLIGGGGPGGGPRVLAIDGRSLIQNGPSNLVPLANFFGGDPNSRGGIRVASKDFDGDQRDDLIVGAGENAGSQVTWYKSSDLLNFSEPPATYVFNAFDDVLNGVFVG